jgi:hypothetical protein
MVKISIVFRIGATTYREYGCGVLVRGGGVFVWRNLFGLSLILHLLFVICQVFLTDVEVDLGLRLRLLLWRIGGHQCLSIGLWLLILFALWFLLTLCLLLSHATQDSLDVLTLKERLHSIKEIVVCIVIKGTEVLYGFGVQHV